MKNTAISISLIYEDADVLAVDKPAGMLTIPDRYDRNKPNLADILKEAHGDLWVVHRLDAMTSGVILFARGAPVHKALNTAFEMRQVEKVYHALVRGSPAWEETTVDLPLSVDAGSRHRTLVDMQHGKSAATSLKVLTRYRGYTLIEARPHSGYTHQIRVHLANQKFPVLCDPLYGNDQPLYLSAIKPHYRPSPGRRAAASLPSEWEPEEARPAEERPLLARLGLHAWSLSFAHPATGALLSLHAPYPKDLSVTLSKLNKYAPR